MPTLLAGTLFSFNDILLGLWLNSISSVEMALFLLDNLLMQQAGFVSMLGDLRFLM